MARHSPEPQGFTLIELSIVLVIIGLIVGGVLVGQDLIRSAAVRAQVTQIEKFNQAVNTFYGKYGALPGDLNAQIANQFGFTPRGSYAGQGDGNGFIQGIWGNDPNANSGGFPYMGEAAVFWVDLTSANGLNVNLIEGSFHTGNFLTAPSTPLGSTTTSLYMPAAKIGRGNYVYVYGLEGNLAADGAGSCLMPEANYFTLVQMSLTSIGPGPGNAGLTVTEANAIDTKIDDGLPLSGNVLAEYNGANSSFYGGAENGSTLAPCSTNSNPASTPATPGSSTSCFDNGGTAGTPMKYSLSQSGGNNVNCALSFKMQAGD